MHAGTRARARASESSTSPQFKGRSARERETDFERFPEVGGKELKATQPATADVRKILSLSLEKTRRGTRAVRSFRDCLPCYSWNINRA